MSNTHPPYDTSFAHSFNWTPPENLQEALEILNCPGVSCCCSASGSQVKSLLASNPNTPAAVLEHLAQCTDSPTVLERLAGNPNTTPHTLRRLARHHNNDVRSAVAESVNADQDTITTLARDAHTDVRFRLAENYNAPVDVLLLLLEDENPYVASRAQTTLSRVSDSASIRKHRPPYWSGAQQRAAG